MARGRRRYRRKRYKAKATTAVDKKQSRQISRLIATTRPEVKTYNTVVRGGQSNVTVLTGPGVQYMFTAPIIQGIGATQRIGTKVQVTAITLDILMRDNLALDLNQIGAFSRFILVHDKRYSGTMLTKADILENSTITDGEWDDLLSYYDIDAIKCFPEPAGKSVDILFDKSHIYGRTNFAVQESGGDLTAGYSSTEGNSSKLFRYHKKFTRPIMINYGTSAGGKSSQIYLVVCPGYSSSTDRNPFHDFVCTIFYTDS